MCQDGKVYLGCNIENGAYSPSNCAERTAFFKAVSEGERAFQAIAIVGGKDELIDCYPCGVCRQVMGEFCDPDKFELFAEVPQMILKYFYSKNCCLMAFNYKKFVH